MKKSDPCETYDLMMRVDKIANTLNYEIQAQRTLNAAEDNELSLMITRVEVSQVLQEICELYSSNLLAKDRTIETSPDQASVTITTDRVLLKRVISNMVKNALEGCRPGSIVTLGSNLVKDGVQIWVHNPGYMSREVQLQIFQRSFSTKGSGRGLGTFGIKLLTERYLKGKTTFSVSPDDGVIFSVILPMV
jgi:signal transduction histidine kinase